MSPHFQLALQVACMGHLCHIYHIFPSVLGHGSIAGIRRIGGFIHRQLQYYRFPSTREIRVLCASL